MSEGVEIETARSFSPSRLDVFKDCPRRYRFRYVDRIRRPSQSVEAFLGTCVHTAFETLYEAKSHGKLLSLEETLAGFEKAWKEGWSEEIAIRKPEFGPEDWRRLGAECVARYYEAHAPFDEDRTVAVERKVGFPLRTSGGEVRIEGYVDRLALGPDGAFEVHDYKTAASLPTQADVDEDWQLALYDLAVRHMWPDTKDVRLLWHYVRHGKTLVSRRSAEQREALSREVAALVESIWREREFPTRKSALCDWCEYRDLCPLFAHAEKLRALEPEQMGSDDGARLVGELSALDKQKRELKEKLKALEPEQKAVETALAAFAKAQGVTVVAGLEGEASVVEKEDWKLPTKTHALEAYEALEKELRASPLWPEVAHLDAHALLEGFKSRKWAPETMTLVESLLERYARRTRETTVRLRRKREAEPE